ncbi:MAG: peptidoglycan-binding protein [Candidatus Puniceispirillales bacterium]
MALARRNRSGGPESYIWPGFVDGLATLLMVIIFVLMVFFLIQTNLAVRVSGQDQTLTKLRSEISTLAELLNLERSRAGDLLLDNQRLEGALASAETTIEGLNSRIAALEESLGLATARNDDLATRLETAIERAGAAETEAASKQAVIDQRNLEIENLAARLAAMEQAYEAQLAERNTEIANRDETIRATRQEILLLTQSINALKMKLGQLQALLDEKEEEARLAKEASLNLTRKLNDALSSKVAELQRFRSEFFGRLRDILKDRADIRIVGDRFVFQSEVLFDLGSADIGAEGQKQLLELSTALREISDSIPTDIDWVLQVSGHTDDLPINTPLYRDNWDLSSARAISVVRYLILAGVDPDRLSATGFGEFQPIDNRDNDAARARNRRIELKLTQR